MKVLDGKVEDHEKRIKDIETKGVSGGGVSQGSGGGEFIPQHLEVKGFCTFEQRQTKGVSRAMITEFINGFKESLNEVQKTWVGAPVVRSLKSYKFKVKVNADFVWEVKELWTNYVIDLGTELSGKTPYFIVERSPEAQKIFNKMGAAFAALQKKIKAPKVITADWRSKEFFIKEVKDGEENEQSPLLTIQTDLALKCWEEVVAISGFSEAALAAALR